MPNLTLMANEPAGTQLRLLTFRETPENYSTPGQYVTATTGELKPSFFAIASSPGQPLQLLLKVAGDTATALAALEPGAEVTISEAKGNGFPLDAVSGRPLVVLVNGSGISAARPVIDAEVAAGLPRPVHVYYGVLTPDRRSFLADLERWANAGVQVHTVVGTPVGTGWHGQTGFVQEAATADGLCRADVGVVLVGVRPMIEAAKALWTAAGCPPEALLLNF